MDKRCRRLAAVWLLSGLGLAMTGAPPSAQAAAIDQWLSLQTAAGTSIALRIRLDPAAPPGPALLVLGGVHRGAGALDLLPELPQLVLASFDYPVEIPERLDWRQALALRAQLRAAVNDTREAMRLSFDALQAHPQVDAQRIAVIGASLGAPFALWAAAERAFSAAVLVHGFANVERTLQHQLWRAWRDPLGPASQPAAALAARMLMLWLRLPDPRQTIAELRTRLPVLLVVAEADRRLPEAASRELIDALRSSRVDLTLRYSAGGHLRGSAPQSMEKVLGEVLPWLQQLGWLSAPLPVTGLAPDEQAS